MSTSPKPAKRVGHLRGPTPLQALCGVVWGKQNPERVSHEASEPCPLCQEIFEFAKRINERKKNGSK